MSLLIKMIFLIISKYRHYSVILNHWFWVKHYKDKLFLDELKLSDRPLNFIIEDEGIISISLKTYFSGSSKLLVIHQGKLEIGEGCYFNRNCSLNSLDHITIGEHCLFGENVKLYDHNHRFNNLSMHIRDQGYSKAPIRIGKNTWVGSNVTILKGVQIGSNSVIAAGSLVTSNVPDNSILSPSGIKSIKYQ